MSPSTLEAGNASILRRHENTETAVQAAVEAGRNLPNVPMFASMLRKKAASGLPSLRPWLSRYFVLDDSGLSWFASETASSSDPHADNQRRRRSHFAEGRVPLHQLMSAAALPAKGPSRFVLNVRIPRGGGRAYLHLKAENAALMRRWLELISRHVQERSDGLCYTQSGPKQPARPLSEADATDEPELPSVAYCARANTGVLRQPPPRQPPLHLVS